MSVITKDQLADAAAEQGKKRGRVRKLYVKNSSPIPNWYLDEMIANSDIPTYVHAVFLFLLRRTIGWDKKSEKVDLSDIECGACVSRKSAVHAVRLLCDCWGIFTVERGKGRAKSTFTIGDWERDIVSERMTCVGWVYDTQAPSPRELQLVPCTPATIERGRKLWNDYIAKPRNKQRAPLEAVAVS